MHDLTHDIARKAASKRKRETPVKEPDQAPEHPKDPPVREPEPAPAEQEATFRRRG